LADSILKGQWVVHQTFLPLGFLGSLHENPYALDLEKAKALMAESGLTLPIEIGFTVRNNQERLDIATSIQNTFAQVGINLVMDVGDGKQGLETYRGRKHEITLQTWGPDYPDPHTNASTFALNPDNSDAANATGYLAWRTAWDPGAELNAETEAAVVEKDSAKRAEMYADIQRKVRDNSAFVLMFQQARQDAMRANVNGFYAGGATTRSATGRSRSKPQGRRPAWRRPRSAMTDTSVPHHENRFLRLAQQIGLGFLTLAITILGLLLVTFIIGRVVPIDPVLSIVGERATEAQMQAVRDKLGLDLPMWQQFAIYVWDAVQGDLGTSIRTGESISAEISRYFPATLELATLGTIFGTLVGVPAGVLAATRPGSIADQIVRVVGLMGYSMPVFWLGLIGLLVFYGQLD